MQTKKKLRWRKCSCGLFQLAELRKLRWSESRPQMTELRTVADFEKIARVHPWKIITVKLSNLI
jgi:hypothetical protein